MPKNSKNKKRGGSRPQEATAAPLPRPRNDDEESLGDNWSTQSVLSETSSLHGSDPVTSVDGDTADEVSEQENFEDRFAACLEGMTQKSAKSRTTALQGLQNCLKKRYVADFLLDRILTVSDSLVKCLRKGKGEEQASAALCLCLMSIQLGEEAESVFTASQSLLQSLMMDNSVQHKARGACAMSLAISCILSCNDQEKKKSLTRDLEDLFSMGYGKGENSPSMSPEKNYLVSQALSAWSLLLTVAPFYQVQTHIKDHLGSLQDLLENSDLDLRIATGEAIAILYELARDDDEDFEHGEEESLCELLKRLATDSVKYRAKKDRRQQRSCFRDIQRYIVDDESPYETVRIGKEDMLEINTWVQKKQYDSFCYVLSTGTSVHMKNNPLLRDVFGLGPPVLEDSSHTKSLTKAQRSSINAAAFKARTKARQKHRDKRSIVANNY